MHIAIADDRKADQAELKILLERYCSQQELVANYDFYASAEALLDDFSPGRFDLVFLDIYMGECSGMEAAREIARRDSCCRVIFFTTSHTHAVESYEVRAAYYLTKPLDYSRLSAAMDTACADLQKENRGITLHCGGIPCELLLRDILFADCSAEHTRLHLIRSVVTVDERVSEVAGRLLNDPRFLNCNRNLAVNMDQILQTKENNFLLKNGESIPIRQRDCGAVKRAFLQYSLRALRKEHPIGGCGNA